MGRYKGKREAPRVGGGGSGELPGKHSGGFGGAGAHDAQGGAHTARKWPEAAPRQAVDPFAREDLPEKESGAKRFFRSTPVKIVLVALCCVAAFGVGALIALDGWVKPPDLPDSVVSPDTQTRPPVSGEEDPVVEEPPSDDELYPDDGYDGDMPTVSGDRKEGVYTFLLVGTDKDDGNTDTIMVASYDTVNQAVNIMSIPRDTMINESWDLKKINSVYSRTGSSINALSNRVRKLVGFKPDFHVKVDLSMFVELVDLIGGVEFDVPQDMYYSDPYQDLLIDLKAGRQVLDGDKAMQLVRFRRYAEGDIKRVQVQQDFMKALIKECLSLKHWGKIKAYIELGLENVQTDLEFGSVVWFAANVMGLNEAPMLSMANVSTCTIPGNYFDGTWSRTFPNSSDKQSYVTIYPNQTVTLVNEKFNPYVQKVTTGMLDAMSILENGDIASSTGSLKDTTHNDWMAVRRGEAYYDDEGKVVYGQPPEEPEVDEFGSYYILDENGNKVYTDENGTPLEGQEPGGLWDPEQGALFPWGGQQPGQSGETPGQGGQSSQQETPGEGQQETPGQSGQAGQWEDPTQDDPLGETGEAGQGAEAPQPELSPPGGTEGLIPDWLVPGP